MRLFGKNAFLMLNSKFSIYLKLIFDKSDLQKKGTQLIKPHSVFR